jgi:hypothetical protein
MPIGITHPVEFVAVAREFAIEVAVENASKVPPLNFPKARIVSVFIGVIQRLILGQG